jgi:hypothetical protein
MYDAAPAASLRDKGGADITASGALAGLTLDTLGGYWNNGELADQTLAVVVNVTEIDNVTGTYDINLEAGPVGFATAKVVGSLKGVTEATQHVILLDMDTVRALKADAAAIRLNVTANDTDGAGAGVPSINFYAFIAPIIR